MKKIMLSLFLLLSFLLGKAQSADDSVKVVVNKLFAAMKRSDAKAIQECFADSAILQTVGKNGAVHNKAIKEFAVHVGGLPKDSADERIVFDVVKVDADLAVVWAPYQFYYAGKFSHCGVDAFQLVRVAGVWKIQYLIDTRRRTDCR